MSMRTNSATSRAFIAMLSTLVIATLLVVVPSTPADALGARPKCNGKTATVVMAWGEKPTNARDVIVGTSGRDVISVGYGETVCSGGGNDAIQVYSHNTWVNAGAGDDRVWGKPSGNVFIYGGTGNDTIEIDEWSNWIEAHGGAGDDTIIGGAGRDRLYGDDGNDTIEGRRGDDTIDGGTGNDILRGHEANDTIQGGPGNDRIAGHDGNDTIRGGDGNDSIWAHAGNDTVHGDGGNDRILGYSGIDYLYGGTGSDQIWGGDHNDFLYGNGGNDELFGEAGTDVSNGGSGTLDYCSEGGTSCELTTNDRARIAAVGQAKAAFESYERKHGSYILSGGGAYGSGTGWYKGTNSTSYRTSIASVLIAGNHISGAPKYVPSGDALVYRCKDRVAIFSKSDKILASSTDKNWWTSNGCTNYPASRGYNYFQLTKASSYSQDDARIEAVRKVVTALEAYGQDNNTFLVTGSGNNQTGTGWYQYEAGNYTTSIANALVAGGYLQGGSNLPVDPNDINPNGHSGFDLLVYRCQDRVAVFSRSEGAVPAASDKAWWTNPANNCTQWANTGGLHPYYRLSRPINSVLTPNDAQRVAAVDQVVAALEHYERKHGNYRLLGSGYYAFGAGQYKAQNGTSYPQSMYNLLRAGGHISGTPKFDPTGDFYIYRCKNRIGVFAKADRIEAAPADRTWWTTNGCTQYPNASKGHTYFRLSKPSSYSEDDARVDAVTAVRKALEAFSADHHSYMVSGAGSSGRGNGWYQHAGATNYPVSIAQKLVELGYLTGGNMLPRDPVDWRPNSQTSADFLIYRCKNRVGVFSRSNGLRASTTDSNWWASNGCNQYPITSNPHLYFQLSKPLPAVTCHGKTVTVNLGLGQAPTSRADVIMGTIGNDTIVASQSDTVCAGHGDDIVRGAKAFNHYVLIDGGPGNDNLTNNTPRSSGTLGGSGVIYGGTGNDTIVVTGNAHTVHGGAGHDKITGGTGFDTLNGDDGNDTIVDMAGENTVNGGEGNDKITTGDRRDTIDGGGGNDTIRPGDFASNTVQGGPGDDKVYGGTGQDTIHGGTGNDTLHGGIHNDTINGNAGNDIITGGPGVDTLNGGAGNDDIHGNEHSGGAIDKINGGNGTDTCHDAGAVNCELKGDNVAPTDFDFRVTTSATQYLAVNWDTSTDAVGVTKYELYVDGQIRGRFDPDTHRYTVGGLTANRIYEIEMQAVDEQGNTSTLQSVSNRTGSGKTYSTIDPMPEAPPPGTCSATAEPFCPKWTAGAELALREHDRYGFVVDWNNLLDPTTPAYEFEVTVTHNGGNPEFNRVDFGTTEFPVKDYADPTPEDPNRRSGPEVGDSFTVEVVAAPTLGAKSTALTVTVVIPALPQPPTPTPTPPPVPTPNPTPVPGGPGGDTEPIPTDALTDVPATEVATQSGSWACANAGFKRGTSANAARVRWNDAIASPGDATYEITLFGHELNNPNLDSYQIGPVRTNDAPEAWFYNLANSAPYFAHVRALADGGNHLGTCTVWFRTTAPKPYVPAVTTGGSGAWACATAGFKLFRGSDQVRVRWDDAPGAEDYKITVYGYELNKPTLPRYQIGGVRWNDVPSTWIHGLQPSGNYEVEVQGIADGGAALSTCTVSLRTQSVEEAHGVLAAIVLEYPHQQHLIDIMFYAQLQDSCATEAAGHPCYLKWQEWADAIVDSRAKWEAGEGSPPSIFACIGLPSGSYPINDGGELHCISDTSLPSLGAVVFGLLGGLAEQIKGCAATVKDAFVDFVALLKLLDPRDWDDIYNDFRTLVDTLTEAQQNGELISLVSDMAKDMGAGLLRLDLLQDGDGTWAITYDKLSYYAGYMGCQILLDVFASKASARLAEFAQSALKWKAKPDKGPKDNERDNDQFVSCPISSSFPGQTMVLMADGSHERIDEIRPGDWVLSHNLDTSVWEPNLVVDQWSHLDRGPPAMATLADNSTISATDDHLFWVNSTADWTELQDLEVGDELLTPHGTIDVTNVVVGLPREWTVWELTVENNHNFTVHTGTADVLVHNKPPCGSLDNIDAQFKVGRTAQPDITGLSKVNTKPSGGWTDAAPAYTKPTGGGWAQAPSPKNQRIQGVYVSGTDYIFEVKLIDGRTVNVKYDKDGYPDMKPFRDIEVTLDAEFSGRRPDNRDASNKIGKGEEWGDSSPEGYTWHHVENSRCMQLVDDLVHTTLSHEGGIRTPGSATC